MGSERFRWAGMIRLHIEAVLRLLRKDYYFRSLTNFYKKQRFRASHGGHVPSTIVVYTRELQANLQEHNAKVQLREEKLWPWAL